VESSLLKCVFISSKKHKLSLLISHNEASTLCDFLEITINTNVLIFNTNLGIEIYYNSPVDYTNLITHSFLLIASKQGKETEEYRIASFITFPDLKDGIQQMLVKLSSMPLAFNCYSKNLFYQLNKHYEKSNQLIEMLFSIWKQILIFLNLNKQSNFKLNQFEKTLEGFDVKYLLTPLLKQLIVDATSAMRHN